MSAVSTWSTTAADNNSAAPNGFPEGMNPSDVNNSSREMMAAIATWRTNLDVTAITLNGTAITSTAAELNKNDDSAAAVSGFVSGMRMYINEGGLASTSVALMALTPESSFESFGPTGSSATNIWTAMDSIPANARIVIISPEILAVRDSGSAGLVSSTIYARATGNGTAVGNQTKCSAITGYGTAEDSLNYTMPEIFVPLDSSRRFDATWAMTGDVEISSAITLRVKGFVV